MKELRCYFVIDMKSFFASVECVERGLNAMTTNLVVADPDRTEKTICLAVSPSLKKLGVKNRCRMFEIPKNLDYIVAKPRMKKYIEYAAKIYDIYLNYIDKNDIHVYSIDECFIDATSYLKLYNIKAKDFAKKLLDEIWQKLGIPATAGIGTNMYLAKIALDITAKHATDRIGWLTEEKFKKELWHHKPISDFWGISTGTTERLLKYGITDMYGVAHCSEDLLYKEFGINAEIMIDHAWGKEPCLISDIKSYKRKSHSISSMQILPFGYKFDDAKIVLMEMIQEGCYRLAKENSVTQLFHIFVAYEGGQKTKEKGTQRLHVTTNLYSQIAPKAAELFDKVADKNRLIRALGYDFAELQPMNHEQYDLFTNLKQIKKEKKLVNSVIGIKSKFGKNAILKGIDFVPKATQRERNTLIGGHSGGTDKNA